MTEAEDVQLEILLRQLRRRFGLSRAQVRVLRQIVRGASKDWDDLRERVHALLDFAWTQRCRRRQGRDRSEVIAASAGA